MFAACALIASGGAVAALYDSPWAIVDAADPSQVRKDFAPAITHVDGASTRDPRQSDPIAPGKHQITIRFETGRVTQAPSESTRVVDIDALGCTRYRIAAHRTGGTNWEPVVYQEPIGECVAKFRKPGS
jgi:hypothetical protein